MRNMKRVILLGILVVVVLVGCDLFSGSPVTPPPPAAESLQSSPVSTAPSAPSGDATPAVDGRAGLGEVVFARDGQLWAIAADGSNERPLTALPGGSALRDLTLSPDGRYLAFSVNATSVTVLDLSAGTSTPVDQIAAGSVGQLVWSTASDTLYYHKMMFDANSVPATSEIWSVAVAPGSVSQSVRQTNLADGPAAGPVFALVDGTLILHQFNPSEASMGTWIGYSVATSSAGAPLFPDYGLWDVSLDSSRVLLFSQADVVPGQQRIPTPLYTSTLMAGAIAALVSPQGEQSAYWAVRFAPDGSRIVAIRYTSVNDVAHAETVLLRPIAETTGYEVVALSPDPGVEDVAFSWHGEDGVVVQRLRPGVAEALSAELWLLPLDGSPGRMLTLGETPLSIGGR